MSTNQSTSETVGGYLLGAVLAVAILFLIGCAFGVIPQADRPIATVTITTETCTEVPFQEGVGWDYTAVSTEASTGIWSTDGDSGPIIGYSLAEDSVVYETEQMARTCPAYHR